MPALVGPQQGAAVAATLAADAPVRIGALTLPFGPRLIQEQHQARLAVQKGINATFFWDYGQEPVQYTIEGWASQSDLGIGGDLSGDVALMRKILAQFPTASTVQRLQVPSQGIATMVILQSAVVSEDAQQGPREPFYHLVFLEASQSNPGQA